MRLRDVKVGQKVKIKLPKTAIDLGVDERISGRVGTVINMDLPPAVQVSVVNLGVHWVYPREIQLKKGKKS